MSAQIRELARLSNELASTQQALAEWRARLSEAEARSRAARTNLLNLMRSGHTGDALAEAHAALDTAATTVDQMQRRCQILDSKLGTLSVERAGLGELARPGRAAAGTPGPPPRAVADAPGHDLCPDPLAAKSAAELVAALRRYRIWAGEPSYREMARCCKGNIAASTLNTALRSDELPTLPVVLAVITACGGSDEDQSRFATAWRELRLAQEDSTQQAAPPRALRSVSAAS